MTTQRENDGDTRRASMPGGARLAVLAAVAAVLVGSLYLIAVRGEALLVDLSKLGAAVFCF